MTPHGPQSFPAAFRHRLGLSTVWAWPLLFGNSPRSRLQTRTPTRRRLLNARAEGAGGWIFEGKRCSYGCPPTSCNVRPSKTRSRCFPSLPTIGMGASRNPSLAKRAGGHRCHGRRRGLAARWPWFFLSFFSGFFSLRLLLFNSSLPLLAFLFFFDGRAPWNL